MSVEDIPPMDDDIAKRPLEVDPNQGRCLIENRAEKAGVLFIHVFARENTLRYRMMGALEWSWGMRLRGLHLDTRRNVFFVGPVLYQLYQDKKWALVPVDEVLDRYFHSPDTTCVRARDSFPVEEEHYQYKIIPLKDMEDVYITHQTHQGPVGLYHHPYDTFPVLTSHLSPRFAIVHVGTILSSSNMKPGIRRTLIEKYPTLERVMRLYHAWTGLVPTASEKDAIYNAPVPTYSYNQPSESMSRSNAAPKATVQPECNAKPEIGYRLTAWTLRGHDTNHGDDWELQKIRGWMQECGGGDDAPM